MATITRFERTRIVGARALQLAFGAPAMVENKKVLSPYDLAKIELEEKVVPLSVIRNLPNGESIRLEVN